MKKLIVDADACPVLAEAIAIARSAGIRIILVGNVTQNLRRYVGESGVEVVEVDAVQDEADFAIFNRTGAGDVLVTNDTGLAAMVLGKGALVVTPRGRSFRHDTIDGELNARHEAKKTRRAGGRTKGPSPFTQENRERFEQMLRRMLVQN